ncbi:MAG: hypothetical protein EOO10_11765 [Chitinophagaceae bacterium]|nr:MAG: hypothetical protein EOO10_11765 [Chitinophagaceae bacterium]
MKNLSLIFLLCFLTVGFSACAQASFIKKGKAFIRESSPGTEMLDDNGNPTVQPKIVSYMAYVELAGAAPEWKYAWYNNQVFAVTATKIEEKKLEVGIDKSTGEKITMLSAKGNQLWQLELIPAKDASKSIKTKGDELILEGIRQNKSFRYRIPKLIVLQTPDAV